jgi:hypothetical protein
VKSVRTNRVSAVGGVTKLRRVVRFGVPDWRQYRVFDRLTWYVVQKGLAKMYTTAKAVLARKIKTCRKVSSHRETSLHNEHVSDPGTLAKLSDSLPRRVSEPPRFF